MAPLQQLAYCWPNSQVMCQWLDGASLSKRDETSVSIVTKQSYYQQTRTPDCFDARYPAYPWLAGACYGGEPWSTTSAQDYYTASVENYYIQFYMAPRVPGSAKALALRRQGWLRLKWEPWCHSWPGTVRSYQFPEWTKVVQLPLSEVANATGDCYAPLVLSNSSYWGVRVIDLLVSTGMYLNLDDQLSPPYTLRDTGLAVFVHVKFSNTRPIFGKEDEVTWMIDAEAGDRTMPTPALKDEVINQTLDTRTLKVDSVLVFRFLPDGELATRFSIPATFATLSAAYALIALAGLGVNFFAKKCLKRRLFYQKVMDKQTAYSTYIEKLMDLPKDELTKELAKRHLSAAGKEEDRILRLLEAGWAEEEAEKADPGQSAEKAAEESRALAGQDSGERERAPLLA